MKTGFKSLACIATTAAALTGGFAQNAAPAEVREPEPKPGPPNFVRQGASPSASRVPVAEKNRKSGRELRAYTTAIGPFSEKNRGMIIRGSKSEPKVNDQIQEDLAVMYRILQKAIGKRTQDEKVMKMGIPLLTLPGMAARSMYLEDYGVLFTFAVDIPLVPEAAAEKKVADDSDEANEEWEEARNDLFGQRHAFKVGHKNNRPYDQGDVDELKESIIEALHNASNIRNLKPNDWITVVIQGKRFDSFAWPVEADKFRFEVEQNVFVSNDEAAPESTLVLRVRKSDVDDVARKKGEKGSLKNKVSIAIY